MCPAQQRAAGGDSGPASATCGGEYPSPAKRSSPVASESPGPGAGHSRPTGTGTGRLVRVPSPSCPPWFKPQQYSSPAGVKAQVTPPPAKSLENLSSPANGIGTGDVSVVPLPSCPWRFWPQQRVEPSLRSAQVCTAPAARVFAGAGRSEVGEGRTCVSGRMPLPNWPKRLSPQHSTWS